MSSEDDEEPKLKYESGAERRGARALGDAVRAGHDYSARRRIPDRS